MSLIAGITGQPVELFDGAKINSISEYTSGNGVQLQGRTNGVAIEAGKVGEERVFTGSGNVSTNTSSFVEIGSLTLIEGVWQVSATCISDTAASQTGFLSKFNLLGVDGTGWGDTYLAANYPAGLYSPVSFIPRTVRVSAGTADKTIKVLAQSITASGYGRAKITAVRIA